MCLLGGVHLREIHDCEVERKATTWGRESLRLGDDSTLSSAALLASPFRVALACRTITLLARHAFDLLQAAERIDGHISSHLTIFSPHTLNVLLDFGVTCVFLFNGKHAHMRPPVLSTAIYIERVQDFKSHERITLRSKFVSMR